MLKITPHLWFDKEAIEVVEFYTSLFPNSKITNVTTLQDTPSGDSDVISFELSGYPFMAISAGSIFKLNPSISFILNFDPSRNKNARERIDKFWKELMKDGSVLMPLGKYPFSEKYGWIQDKYGISWQLLLSNPEGEERPFIVPSIMFVGKVCGKAEDAITFYTSIFNGSKRGRTTYYTKGMEPEKEGTIMFSDFMIKESWFAAVDSALRHNFNFNEALSFLIPCETQEEIDYYWENLSAVPEAEQCGWLKDKFGLSWQVSPTILGEMMKTGTRTQINQVTKAFLLMKKLDIVKLKEVFNG